MAGGGVEGKAEGEQRCGVLSWKNMGGGLAEDMEDMTRCLAGGSVALSSI